ncbi:MAG: hypothetical protein B7733_17100 [Myxococcales bacterium FL481]|nr:MAG: hypothetical protein B7733_17100 [Myxococcales bacterium FL481]
MDCAAPGPDEVVVQMGELRFFDGQATSKPPGPDSPRVQLRWETSDEDWHAADLAPDENGCARHLGVSADVIYLIEYFEYKTLVSIGAARQVDLRQRYLLHPEAEPWHDPVKLTFEWDPNDIGAVRPSGLYCADSGNRIHIGVDSTSLPYEATVELGGNGQDTRAVAGALGRECTLFSEAHYGAYTLIEAAQALPPIDLSLGDQRITVALERQEPTVQELTWDLVAAQQLLEPGHPDAQLEAVSTVFVSAIQMEPNVWGFGDFLLRQSNSSPHEVLPPTTLPFANPFRPHQAVFTQSYSVSAKSDERVVVSLFMDGGLTPSTSTEEQAPHGKFISPPRTITIDGQPVGTMALPRTTGEPDATIEIVPGSETAAAATAGYRVILRENLSAPDELTIRSSSPRFRLPSDLVPSSSAHSISVTANRCYDESRPNTYMNCGASNTAIHSTESRK